MTAIWRAKVLAFLHDPPEKALILLRGRGHEAGTVAAMRKELLGEELEGVRREASALEDLVRRADRWGAAADRPTLPRGGARVVFAANPQLIHPLSGERIALRHLLECRREDIEKASFAGLKDLVVRTAGGDVDWERTFLKLWRFAPAKAPPGLGELWRALPADTRSPDHTIWEHLSLTSAFAGALAAEGAEPALLLVSFGPVQEFIAAARTLSDLWAGSHLLSRMAWEGMRVVVEAWGPDAVLYPVLRGVGLVDLWLRDRLGDWPERDPLWQRSDEHNPLLAAALPNRFVALVPAAAAPRVAEEIGHRVREWVREQAEAAWERIRGMTDAEDSIPRAQIRRQLQGFPEVYWSLVPWTLAGAGDALADGPLRDLLRRLGYEGDYLGQASDVLRKEIPDFYKPNPGVAYPGLMECLERLHGAAKAVRPFDQVREEGYRCSLCGEREWLTTDRSLLSLPPGKRREATVWGRLADRRPGIAKEGEHLCGLCTLKRLWPQMFVDALSQKGITLRRFVVSTHALAVAGSLAAWAAKGTPSLPIRLEKGGAAEPIVLPRKLVRMLGEREEDLRTARRVVAALDATESEAEGEALRRRLREAMGAPVEAYYALVLMDGDRLGKWLSGELPGRELASRFHETTLADLQQRAELTAYLQAKRPVSPALHLAVSAALNAFAVRVAPIVVEELFMGKLLYAGGDDLLALVTVRDLLGLLTALRCAYSGVTPRGMDSRSLWRALSCRDDRLVLRQGYACLRRRGSRTLLRLMGPRATASLGAVVAHHQAPLRRVLRSLRAVERRAKDGGRDRFVIAVEKRAGGTTEFGASWELEVPWPESAMGLLLETRNLLADLQSGVSRRAVYALVETLENLERTGQALAPVLRYQLERQARREDTPIGDLPERLARAAARQEKPTAWVQNLLLTAEFLARSGRVPEGVEVPA